MRLQGWKEWLVSWGNILCLSSQCRWNIGTDGLKGITEKRSKKMELKLEDMCFLMQCVWILTTNGTTWWTRWKTVANIFFFLLAFSSHWNYVSCQNSCIVHIRRCLRKPSRSPSQEMTLLCIFWYCSWDWYHLHLTFFKQYQHLIWSNLFLVLGAVDKPATNTYIN